MRDGIVQSEIADTLFNLDFIILADLTASKVVVDQRFDGARVAYVPQDFTEVRTIRPIALDTVRDQAQLASPRSVTIGVQGDVLTFGGQASQISLSDGNYHNVLHLVFAAEFAQSPVLEQFAKQTLEGQEGMQNLLEVNQEEAFVNLVEVEITRNATIDEERQALLAKNETLQALNVTPKQFIAFLTKAKASIAAYQETRSLPELVLDVDLDRAMLEGDAEQAYRSILNRQPQTQGYQFLVEQGQRPTADRTGDVFNRQRSGYTGPRIKATEDGLPELSYSTKIPAPPGLYVPEILSDRLAQKQAERIATGDDLLHLARPEGALGSNLEAPATDNQGPEAGRNVSFQRFFAPERGQPETASAPAVTTRQLAQTLNRATAQASSQTDAMTRYVRIAQRINEALAKAETEAKGFEIARAFLGLVRSDSAFKANLATSDQQAEMMDQLRLIQKNLNRIKAARVQTTNGANGRQDSREMAVVDAAMNAVVEVSDMIYGPNRKIHLRRESVLEYLQAGKPVDRIALLLSVSPNTVRRDRQHLIDQRFFVEPETTDRVERATTTEQRQRIVGLVSALIPEDRQEAVATFVEHMQQQEVVLGDLTGEAFQTYVDYMLGISETLPAFDAAMAAQPAVVQEANQETFAGAQGFYPRTTTYEARARLRTERLANMDNARQLARGLFATRDQGEPISLDLLDSLPMQAIVDVAKERPGGNVVKEIARLVGLNPEMVPYMPYRLLDEDENSKDVVDALIATTMEDLMTQIDLYRQTGVWQYTPRMFLLLRDDIQDEQDVSPIEYFVHDFIHQMAFMNFDLLQNFAKEMVQKVRQSASDNERNDTDDVLIELRRFSVLKEYFPGLYENFWPSLEEYIDRNAFDEFMVGSNHLQKAQLITVITEEIALALGINIGLSINLSERDQGRLARYQEFLADSNLLLVSSVDHAMQAETLSDRQQILDGVDVTSTTTTSTSGDDINVEWDETYQTKYLRVGDIVVMHDSLEVPAELEEGIQIIRTPAQLDYTEYMIPAMTAMLELDLQGKTIEMNGIGSGVLGQLALMLGAKRVVGIDRDQEALAQAKLALERDGRVGQILTADEWVAAAPQAEDQFVLVADDLDRWYTADASARENIFGTDDVIHISNMGPAYTVQDALVAHVLSDSMIQHAILTGYAEGVNSLVQQAFGGNNLSALSAIQLFKQQQWDVKAARLKSGEQTFIGLSVARDRAMTGDTYYIVDMTTGFAQQEFYELTDDVVLQPGQVFVTVDDARQVVLGFNHEGYALDDVTMQRARSIVLEKAFESRRAERHVATAGADQAMTAALLDELHGEPVEWADVEAMLDQGRQGRASTEGFEDLDWQLVELPIQAFFETQPGEKPVQIRREDVENDPVITSIRNSTTPVLPVLAMMSDNRLKLPDGFHRVLGTYLRGDTTIPAYFARTDQAMTSDALALVPEDQMMGYVEADVESVYIEKTDTGLRYVTEAGEETTLANVQSEDVMLVVPEDFELTVADAHQADVRQLVAAVDYEDIAHFIQPTEQDTSLVPVRLELLDENGDVNQTVASTFVHNVLRQEMAAVGGISLIEANDQMAIAFDKPVRQTSDRVLEDKLRIVLMRANARGYRLRVTPLANYQVKKIAQTERYAPSYDVAVQLADLSNYVTMDMATALGRIQRDGADVVMSLAYAAGLNPEQMQAAISEDELVARVKALEETEATLVTDAVAAIVQSEELAVETISTVAPTQRAVEDGQVAKAFEVDAHGSVVRTVADAGVSDPAQLAEMIREFIGGTPRLKGDPTDATWFGYFAGKAKAYQEALASGDDTKIDKALKDARELAIRLAIDPKWQSVRADVMSQPEWSAVVAIMQQYVQDNPTHVHQPEGLPTTPFEMAPPVGIQAPTIPVLPVQLPIFLSQNGLRAPPELVDAAMTSNPPEVIRIITEQGGVQPILPEQVRFDEDLEALFETFVAVQNEQEGGDFNFKGQFRNNPHTQEGLPQKLAVKYLTEGSIPVLENAGGKTLVLGLAAAHGVAFHNSPVTIIVRADDVNKTLNDQSEEHGYVVPLNQAVAETVRRLAPGKNVEMINFDQMIADYEAFLSTRNMQAATAKAHEIIQVLQDPDKILVVSQDARGHLPNKFTEVNLQYEVQAALAVRKGPNARIFADEIDDLLLKESTYIVTQGDVVEDDRTAKEIVENADALYQTMVIEDLHQPEGAKVPAIRAVATEEEFIEAEKAGEFVYYRRMKASPIMTGHEEIVLSKAVYEYYQGLNKDYERQLVHNVLAGIVQEIGSVLSVNDENNPTELVPVAKGGEVQTKMLASSLAFKVAQTNKYNEGKAKAEQLKLSRIRISAELIRENPIQEMFTGESMVAGLSATRTGAESVLLAKAEVDRIVVIGESDFFAQESKGGIETRVLGQGANAYHDDPVVNEFITLIERAKAREGLQNVNVERDILFLINNAEELNRIEKALSAYYAGQDDRKIFIVGGAAKEDDIEDYVKQSKAGEQHIILALPRLAKARGLKGHWDVVVHQPETFTYDFLTHAMNRNTRQIGYKGFKTVIVDEDNLAENMRFIAGHLQDFEQYAASNIFHDEKQNVLDIRRFVNEAQGYFDRYRMLSEDDRRIGALRLAATFNQLEQRSSSHKTVINMILQNMNVTEPIQALERLGVFADNKYNQQILQDIRAKQRNGYYSPLPRLMDQPFTGAGWVYEAIRSNRESALQMLRDIRETVVPRDVKRTRDRNERIGLTEDALAIIDQLIEHNLLQKRVELAEFHGLRPTLRGLNTNLDQIAQNPTAPSIAAVQGVHRVLKGLSTDILPSRIVSSFQPEVVVAFAERQMHESVKEATLDTLDEVVAGLTAQQKAELQQPKYGFVTAVGDSDFTERGQQFLEIVRSLNHRQLVDQEQFDQLAAIALDRRDYWGLTEQEQAFKMAIHLIDAGFTRLGDIEEVAFLTSFWTARLVETSLVGSERTDLLRKLRALQETARFTDPLQLSYKIAELLGITEEDTLFAYMHDYLESHDTVGYFHAWKQAERRLAQMRAEGGVNKDEYKAVLQALKENSRAHHAFANQSLKDIRASFAEADVADFENNILAYVRATGFVAAFDGQRSFEVLQDRFGQIVQAAATHADQIQLTQLIQELQGEDMYFHVRLASLQSAPVQTEDLEAAQRKREALIASLSAAELDYVQQEFSDLETVGYQELARFIELNRRATGMDEEADRLQAEIIEEGLDETSVPEYSQREIAYALQNILGPNSIVYGHEILANDRRFQLHQLSDEQILRYYQLLDEVQNTDAIDALNPRPWAGHHDILSQSRLNLSAEQLIAEVNRRFADDEQARLDAFRMLTGNQELVLADVDLLAQTLKQLPAADQLAGLILPSNQLEMNRVENFATSLPLALEQLEDLRAFANAYQQLAIAVEMIEDNDRMNLVDSLVMRVTQHRVEQEFVQIMQAILEGRMSVAQAVEEAPLTSARQLFRTIMNVRDELDRQPIVLISGEEIPVDVNVSYQSQLGLLQERLDENRQARVGALMTAMDQQARLVVNAPVPVMIAQWQQRYVEGGVKVEDTTMDFVYEGETISADAIQVDARKLHAGNVGMRRGDIQGLMEPTDHHKGLREAVFAETLAEAFKDRVAQVDQLIVIQRGEEVVALPRSILVQHEIANLMVDGKPIVATACGLCGEAIAVYDAEVNGQRRMFEVSGQLRGKNLVMVDEFDNFFQQVSGQAIIGSLSQQGVRLEPVVYEMMTLAQLREQFDEDTHDIRILLSKTDEDREYFANPYENRGETLGTQFETDLDTVGQTFARRAAIRSAIERQLGEGITLENEQGQLEAKFFVKQGFRVQAARYDQDEVTATDRLAGQDILVVYDRVRDELRFFYDVEGERGDEIASRQSFFKPFEDNFPDTGIYISEALNIAVGEDVARTPVQVVTHDEKSPTDTTDQMVQEVEVTDDFDIRQELSLWERIQHRFDVMDTWKRIAVLLTFIGVFVFALPSKADTVDVSETISPQRIELNIFDSGQPGVPWNLPGPANPLEDPLLPVVPAGPTLTPNVMPVFTLGSADMISDAPMVVASDQTGQNIRLTADNGGRSNWNSTGPSPTISLARAFSAEGLGGHNGLATQARTVGNSNEVVIDGANRQTAEAANTRVDSRLGDFNTNDGILGSRRVSTADTNGAGQTGGDTGRNTNTAVLVEAVTQVVRSTLENSNTEVSSTYVDAVVRQVTNAVTSLVLEQYGSRNVQSGARAREGIIVEVVGVNEETAVATTASEDKVLRLVLSVVSTTGTVEVNEVVVTGVTYANPNTVRKVLQVRVSATENDKFDTSIDISLSSVPTPYNGVGLQTSDEVSQRSAQAAPITGVATNGRNDQSHGARGFFTTADFVDTDRRSTIRPAAATPTTGSSNVPGVPGAPTLPNVLDLTATVATRASVLPTVVNEGVALRATAFVFTLNNITTYPIRGPTTVVYHNIKTVFSGSASSALTVAGALIGWAFSIIGGLLWLYSTQTTKFNFTHFVHGRESFLGTAREGQRIKLYLFKQDRVFEKNSGTWKPLDTGNSERVRQIAVKAVKSGHCPEFQTRNLETLLN